ncbi:MAG: T9SS type A sorting domain-containing protein [Bacteroidota bacterium]
MEMPAEEYFKPDSAVIISNYFTNNTFYRKYYYTGENKPDFTITSNRINAGKTKIQNKYDAVGRRVNILTFNLDTLTNEFVLNRTDSTAFNQYGHVTLRRKTYFQDNTWHTSDRAYNIYYNTLGRTDSVIIKNELNHTIEINKVLQIGINGEIIKMLNVSNDGYSTHPYDSMYVVYNSWKNWVGPLPENGDYDSLHHEYLHRAVAPDYDLQYGQKITYTPDGGFIDIETYNETNNRPDVMPRQRKIVHYDSHHVLDLVSSDTIIFGRLMPRSRYIYSNTYNSLDKLEQSTITQNTEFYINGDFDYRFFYKELAGIASTAYKPIISASPNPFANILDVRINNTPKAVSYTLTDLRGRTLKTAALNAGEEKISINTEDLKPGIYLLSAFSADNVKQTVKVCKPE